MKRVSSQRDKSIDQCIYSIINHKDAIITWIISIKNRSLLLKISCFLFIASHVLGWLVSSFPHGFILLFKIFFFHYFLWWLHFPYFVHYIIDIASVCAFVWLNFILFQFKGCWLLDIYLFIICLYFCKYIGFVELTQGWYW